MMMDNFSTMSLFAHHRSGGSAASGRNSASHRLGVKRADGQVVNTGSTIYRQHGTKIHPGKDVGIDGDDTLFALVNGVIKFERLDKVRKQVSVYPVEETK